MIVTPHDQRRLAVAGLVSPNAVRRCYEGKPVRALTRLRIERTARELGLPAPPPSTTTNGNARGSSAGVA